MCLFLRFLFLEQDLALEDEVQLGVELFLVGGAHHGRSEAFHRVELFGVHVKGDEMDRQGGLLLFRLLFETGKNGGSSAPTVLRPSVRMSTCLCDNGAFKTRWPACRRALPKGVPPDGSEKCRAQSLSARASNGPKGMASRPPEPPNT